MGRTLLGIDLDDSVFGRVVARLLTDEDRRRLADDDPPAADASGERDTSGGSDDDAPASQRDDRPDTDVDAESGDDADSGTALVTRVRRLLLYGSVGAVGVGVALAALRRLLGRFDDGDRHSEVDESNTANAAERGDTDAEDAAERDEGDATNDTGESAVGTLVGLCFLVAVAALVRKFGSQGDGSRDDG